MTTKNKSPFLLAALLPLAALNCYGQSVPGDTTHGDPYTPVGTLAVNPSFVLVGVKPNLDWDIDFPSTFQDLTLITPAGSLLTSEELTVVVQVPGVSGGCEVDDLPVAFWIRTGGASSWQLLFNDVGKQANASKVLYRKKLPANTQIDFAARAMQSSSAWHPIRWTLDDTPDLRYFVNGDATPDDIGDFLTGDVKSFLTPYLSEDLSTVVLGPKEILYLMELETGTPGTDCYDCQDIAFTVQFICKNNNGHGNNVDGVDVSNLGSGGGGPNGEVDPSGDVDDEQPTK